MVQKGVRSNEIKRVVFERKRFNHSFVQRDVARGEVDAVKHGAGGIDSVDPIEEVLAEIKEEACAAAKVKHALPCRSSFCKRLKTRPDLRLIFRTEVGLGLVVDTCQLGMYALVCSNDVWLIYDCLTA